MATIERSAILVKREGNNEIWYYPVTRTEDVLSGDEQLDTVLDDIAVQITAIKNGTVFDTALDSTSTKGVQNKVIYVALDGKVDKVDGKGLSTNDFTTALLTKLNGIAKGATKVVVDPALSSTSTNPVQNKVVNTALGNKVDKVDGKGLSTNDFTTTLLNKLNGIAEGATKTTVDSSMSSSSTNPVQNKVVNTALGNKVDKEDGKVLSSNDYTDTEKTKLSRIAEGATKVVVDSTLSSTSTNAIQNKAVYNALSGKVDSETGKGLSTNDFTDDLLTKLNGIAKGATKVIIDSALSTSSTNPVQNKIVKAAIDDLLTKVNNMIADAPEAYDTFKEISEFISTHQTEYEALLAISNNKVDKVDGKGLSTNDFTTALLNKLNGIAEGATKITVDSSMSSSSTNPVQNKVVYNALAGKVDTKTGKGLSTNDFTDTLLAKLNGIAEGATKISVDSALSSSSTNPVQNKVVYNALAGKVDTKTGKGLSTNDFTDTLLAKLNGLSNYTHPTFTAHSSGIYKITINANGHVSAATAATSNDIKSLLGFDVQLVSSAPSSVSVETYCMVIDEIETVA